MVRKKKEGKRKTMIKRDKTMTNFSGIALKKPICKKFI